MMRNVPNELCYTLPKIWVDLVYVRCVDRGYVVAKIIIVIGSANYVLPVKVVTKSFDGWF